MMVLGVTLSEAAVRAVVAERTRHAIEIVSYHERPLHAAVPAPDELRIALHDLIDETHVREVAMVLTVPDVLITRLPNQERLHGVRERWNAARLVVEHHSFGPNASFKLPMTAEGTTYVAVARGDRVETLARVVREAGGRLVWIDHEAYAWASILPPEAQALLIATPGGARLIIAGRETVEIGTYVPADFLSGASLGESTEGRIAHAVGEEIVAAAKANFADVDSLLVDDPAGHYYAALAAALPASVRIEPFTFALEPERTPWALACGVAQRALQPGHERLSVNFSDVRSPLAQGLARAGQFVGSGDFVALAAGALIAVGLIGWRSETLHTLQTRAATFEQQVLLARRAAAQIDEDLASVATARAVLERVEGAERSGPLTARAVAVIVDRLGPALTATSLGSSGTTWTLAGHTNDATNVGALMTSLQSVGYDAALTSTQEEGPRLAYAVDLTPAAPGATTMPPPPAANGTPAGSQ